MRVITKTVSIPVDQEQREFRLTKLDAFSGAGLLRLIRKYLPSPAAETDAALADRVFSALTEEELRSLMVSCLNHTEVLLEAGYQRVMEGEDWGWPDLSHDAGACLRLTLQCVLWTLRDFFPAAGSAANRARPDS